MAKVLKVRHTEFELAGEIMKGYTADQTDQHGAPINYLSGNEMASCINLYHSSAVQFRLSKSLKASLAGHLFAVQAKCFSLPGNQKLNLWHTQACIVFWDYHSLQNSNQKAHDLILQAAFTSLDTLINESFGRDYTVQQQARWTNARMNALDTRKQWTDVIKDIQIEQGYYLQQPWSSNEFRDLTVVINQSLFGQPHFRCDRDNMTEAQLRKIEQFEFALSERYSNLGTSDARTLVLECLQFFGHPA